MPAVLSELHSIWQAAHGIPQLIVISNEFTASNRRIMTRAPKAQQPPVKEEIPDGGQAERRTLRKRVPTGQSGSGAKRATEPKPDESIEPKKKRKGNGDRVSTAPTTKKQKKLDKHELDVPTSDSQSTERLAAPLDFLSPNPWQLPTKNNAIANFDPNQIARDALETTVIMHPRLPRLITSFLQLKRSHGSKIEQALYAKMSQHDLVARLVLKRALHFANWRDYTVLRDGTSNNPETFDSSQEWLRVGTEEEKENKHLRLAEYLSYDEMMLASLLGTSGPTFFINTGKPTNRAHLDPKTPHQDRGIVIGLAGARFQREGQMDAALMLPPVANGTSRHQDPRLTKVFQDFFGDGPLKGEINAFIYKERISLSVETLLMEADDRAAQAGTTAYVHLPGLGLGVWVLDKPRQSIWYVETVIDCLRVLELNHVSTLELAWITVPPELRRRCEAVGRTAGIQILFNKKAPCAKLNTEELLVRSWAWDSNSMPGNEYWSGFLDSSDDPAAACCSTIAELHNPYVNPFAHRIKVLQSRSKIEG